MVDSHVDVVIIRLPSPMSNYIFHDMASFYFQKNLIIFLVRCPMLHYMTPDSFKDCHTKRTSMNQFTAVSFFDRIVPPFWRQSNVNKVP